MSYKHKIFFAIAPAVFLLDFFTKWLILKNLGIGEEIVVLPNFFDIVHVRNTGAAFGMLANWSENFRVPFFYAISFFAVIALVFSFRGLKPEDHYYSIPLSLITGGVFGNLLDRVRFGSVVDFISLHVGEQSISGVELRWPAFNVADSAITVSIILLMAHALKKR